MRGILIAAGLMALMTGAALAQGGGGGPLDRLRAMDANKDGNITKAEARAARETMFRGLDTNADGFVTEAERTALREAAGKDGPGRGGGGGDTNGDGKISRAEFLDAPYRGFDRLDANNNDIVEASEVEAARAMMGQRKKGTP